MISEQLFATKARTFLILFLQKMIDIEKWSSPEIGRWQKRATSTHTQTQLEKKKIRKSVQI